MCNLFDNSEAYKIYEKVKSVADNCDEYSPQSKDYYTYNDYLYQLDKWYLFRSDVPKKTPPVWVVFFAVQMKLQADFESLGVAAAAAEVFRGGVILKAIPDGTCPGRSQNVRQLLPENVAQSQRSLAV